MNRRDFVSRVVLGGAAAACTNLQTSAFAAPAPGNFKFRFIGLMGFIERKDRSFLVATPDIVIEKAHVLITSGTKEKQNPPNDLNIMAVWRKEGGKWRFLAWGSAKLPAPAAPAAK